MSLLSIMIMCLMVQTIARALVGTSLTFTEELSRYRFLRTFFFGGVIMVKITVETVAVLPHLLVLNIRIPYTDPVPGTQHLAAKLVYQLVCIQDTPVRMV